MKTFNTLVHSLLEFTTESGGDDETPGWWVKGKESYYVTGGREHYQFALRHADEMGLSDYVRKVGDEFEMGDISWDTLLRAIIVRGHWTRIRVYDGFVSVTLPRLKEKYVEAAFDFLKLNSSEFEGMPISFIDIVSQSGYGWWWNESGLQTNMKHIWDGTAWADLELAESRKAKRGKAL